MKKPRRKKMLDVEKVPHAQLVEAYKKRKAQYESADATGHPEYIKIAEWLEREGRL